MSEVYLAEGNVVTLRKTRDDSLQQRVGDLVCDVDGYYKFFPIEGGGYWDPWILRRIADIVDDKNRAWDEQIRQDVGGI